MNYMPPKQRFQLGEMNVDAEHAIIGTCMLYPDRIGEIAAKIGHADFEHPFLSRCFRVASYLHSDNRKPSVESLIEEIGNDEIEPGLTVRAFLIATFRRAVNDEFGPIADAVAVVLDRSQRRRVAAISSTLGTAATSSVSLSDVLAEATANLDEIKSELSRDRRVSYDGKGAAAIVFRHLDDEEATSPTTGLTDLDRVIGGWPKGELSVVAGRPGMGKSAFATSSLLTAARAGHGCVFFSLEMTGKQLGSRLLTDLAYTRGRPIFYQNILRRDVSEMDRGRLQRAEEILSKRPLRIEEQRGLTIADIAARSRKWADAFERDGGFLDVIFVDHMLLVRPTSRYSGNRVREVAEISDGLASLAKELNCAVVALCQLNRGVEGRDEKRPMMSDLRDSGAIEEDASNVLFIYRPAYYLERMKPEKADAAAALQEALAEKRTLLEIIIAKNRNGATGIIDAFVDIGANAVRNKSFAPRTF